MPLPLIYNWRNLFVRKLSTGLTFIVVAAVVFVLSVLLSFAAGIRASLAVSGSPLNVLVIKPGATAEGLSIIPPDEVGRIVQAPGLARDGKGQLLVSQELCVQTSIPRKGPAGALANVAVRGVDEVAFAVHPDVHLIEGTHPRAGALEVIVGRAARDRYTGLELGSQLRMGRSVDRVFTVVGAFEAGGGALESEIWAPRTILTDVYTRRFVSSVVARMESADAVPAAVAYLTGPAVELDARRETDYYASLATKTREIVSVATVLVGIMAVGAAFAVANTMYAAVDGRRREIAMLRTIGFSRRAIIVAFVIESVMVCTVACLVGLGASLVLNGSRQDYLSNATWTVLAYELRVTPTTVLIALGVAVLVGVVGALAPAVRAARTGTVQALRKA
jgi:putative ABC transport system permease protein